MNRATHTITITFAALAAAAAAATMVTTARAATIYGLNHLGQYPDIDMDELIILDSDDPAAYETIGSTGVSGIGFGGLAFDADGTLWAYASFYQATGGAASGLYRIDLDTGAATVQGTLSDQILQDLAYNPADGAMYGINTVQALTSHLYTIDLETGDVSVVGTFTGLPAAHGLIGLAFDAAGNLYVHDQFTDAIYRGEAGDVLSVTQLYALQDNTLGSQGMTIDWSRDDAGYHAMVAQATFPNYASQLNTFATDGSAYVYGGSFGPNFPDGLPPVQLGDIAIMPDTGETVVGDLDGDEAVNVADLLILLSAWGQCDDVRTCPADLSGDEAVDVADLLMLLSNWSA